MIKSIRQQYNENFTEEKYQAFLKDIASEYNYTPSFRIAESPVFVPNTVKTQLFEACEELIDVIVQPNFKELTQGAIEQHVPNEDDHTIFLQMDFGICEGEDGELIPQLIEAQGFPSLYFFQNQLANAYMRHFDIPDTHSHLFGGLTSEEYIELLRETIVGDSHPENVILLEVEPHKQITNIDFLGSENLLGVPSLCISELKKEGQKVYYVKDGRKIKVEKIFNRVIFDELITRDDLPREFFFTDEADVEWIGHPNWFFRISKYTMPFFDSKYVPKTEFLHKIETLPTDLENYVLKPLYSFAGTGVIFHLKKEDIDAIPLANRKNYILQKKVKYAPALQAPDGLVKTEIRMLMLWKKDWERPRIINNLARMSRGEMIGVRYNKDKTWVGASAGFFEKE